MNQVVFAWLVRHRRFTVFFMICGLSAICFLNSWLFRKLFNLDYIRWYVNAGPFIALATATFGAAWGGLDKNAKLVSANPFYFVGACLQVVGLPIQVFGAHLLRKNRQTPISPWETLVILPLMVVFVVAGCGWLLFVMPLQYFVFLVCGSPSRIAMSSSVRFEARMSGEDVEVEERSLTEALRQGWWDASMRDKPVTLASAFSAAALFLLGRVWG